jgi:hypothetical protein
MRQHVERLIARFGAIRILNTTGDAWHCNGRTGTRLAYAHALYNVILDAV